MELSDLISEAGFAFHFSEVDVEFKTQLQYFEGNFRVKNVSCSLY